jgi:predicted PurR-regulated permease PerM
MIHTTRRTRTILVNLGALLLATGILVLLYRDSTEFGNFVAAAFGLSLLLGAIVDRLERHRPPLGTVVAAVSFALACHTYLIGDLIDRSAIREAGMLIGYAALFGLSLTGLRLLRRRP